jgi:hypothetical protein
MLAYVCGLRSNLPYFLIAFLFAILAMTFGPDVASPLHAAVYTWTDEKGVVHMTDRKVEDPSKNVTEIGNPSLPVGSGSRKEIILNVMAQARNDPKFAELHKIVDEYRRSHTYSMVDYFVCIDMALELFNILKTKQYSPKVMAGNVKTDVAGMDPAKRARTFDHAWVVVELSPGVHAALEGTGGFVVNEKTKNFEYYYQGLIFSNPRQAKETDVLMRKRNESCGKAVNIVEDWNANYAGRAADQRMVQTKGWVDAKVAECTEAQKQYEELVKKQYRTLY